MKRPHRLADFAGVALVDILANGLAMLIIVIVLSIASRSTREAQVTAQVEQLETMMSRHFSTSLVLNSLAASPPARLHDYDNSPLDQIHDPYLLPIIELHRNFVREFYSGALWSRAELLRTPNAMDDWLGSFDEERKQRLRVDVYDVTQFYLALSILREYGITVRHWHFVPGTLSTAQSTRCPPGVAAKDCTGGADGESLVEMPELLTETGNSADGTGNPDTWPPQDLSQQPNAQNGTGPFPEGAALGRTGTLDGLLGSGEGQVSDVPGSAGSFPNAQPGLDNARGLLGGSGDGMGPPSGNMRFRLSSPESLSQQEQAFGAEGNNALTPEKILAVLLDFTGTLQAKLDLGVSPAAQLANFRQYLLYALASPPHSSEAARNLIDYLLLQLWAREETDTEQALAVIPRTLTGEGQASTMLIVETNRRLHSVVVEQSGFEDALQLPQSARPLLRLQSHPNVWRGLTLPLEYNSILLLPPTQQRPEQLRWRALAYIAPNFDDFIIGFVYAAVDSDGRLVLPTEDNRVRLAGRTLRPPYRESRFGTRGWLTTFYAGLVLCLLGFLLLVRRLTTERHA